MVTILLKGSRGAEVRAMCQALAAALGRDAADFPQLAASDVITADTEAAIRRWQAGVGVVADGIIGPRCRVLLGLQPPPTLEVALGTNDVSALFPATKPANVSRYLPYVVAALAAAGLKDGSMVLTALGTIRAETEGFLPIAEFRSQFNTDPGAAPFNRYEPTTAIGRKLGNTDAGDGARFRGRGFVQLTGRYNYQRHGSALGLDLAATPDLANAPEIAAALLAEFLRHCAAAMRAALAAGRYAAARKLVNGGSHGLDRFKDVFQRARARPSFAASLPGMAGGRRGQRRAASRVATTLAARPATQRRPLTARRDAPDLRDRRYQPPPVSLLAEFPPEKDVRSFLPRYSAAGLILDQGEEGACTGFGLACVVNYLRWRRDDFPKTFTSVSPRMLYNLARRHDEYAGDDYDGSSCRGALKGWFRHGVCLEPDWPYAPEDARPPAYGYAERAMQNTLGVYYRVDPSSITDLQAAIQEVGAVYVSSFTHDGWNALDHAAKVPRGHAQLPEIPFDGRPSQVDGHAFALVGYNARGFVLQNSWGRQWGAGGFAVVSYDDWLANAMDAWVAALGVPGVVIGKSGSVRVARAGAADRRRWWDEAQAYEHSIVTGNDGRVARYLTEDESSRQLTHQAAGLPDRWFRANTDSATKRLVIYAHGGLNGEQAAITRARAMGRYFTGNGCYPLFLVWKTGLLESIGNILGEAVRKEPPRAAGVGEWLTERSDALIESTVGRALARPIWSEMKENAALAAVTGRGADLLAAALEKLAATWGDAFELHLVGHSAGAIMLGHLLKPLAERDLVKRIVTINLYAPACSVAFANRSYGASSALMERLYVDLLSDQNERDDNVVGIYRKSLLYLVSNALETDLRTPILGLERVFDPDYNRWDGTSATGEALRIWRELARAGGLNQPGRLNVLKADKITQATSPRKQSKASHGGFDNDVDIVTTTLKRITRAKLALAVDDLRGF